MGSCQKNVVPDAWSTAPHPQLPFCIFMKIWYDISPLEQCSDSGSWVHGIWTHAKTYHTQTIPNQAFLGQILHWRATLVMYSTSSTSPRWSMGCWTKTNQMFKESKDMSHGHGQKSKVISRLQWLRNPKQKTIIHVITTVIHWEHRTPRLKYHQAARESMLSKNP